MKTASLIFLSFLAVFSVSAAPLSIVAAENFYGGVARQIAGDGANVTSILTNPNQDPHEFTSNAGTARAVAEADIVIYNGIGYDTWIEKLLATKGRKPRVVLEVAGLIGAAKGGNPHIWYGPKTMPALAEKLAQALAERDPARADEYRKNLQSFKSSLQPELNEIAAIRSAAAGTKVTATEPVFGWMTEALGLKMLNETFQTKVMNDSEPGAAETAAFEQSLTGREAKILFYNSQVGDPTTARMQRIARAAGVPVVGVTETQPPDEKTYADWMLRQLGEVRAALAEAKSNR